MRLIDNLDVNPFFKIVWYSGKIKNFWEPRLKKARDMAYKIEYQSVVHGLRKVNVAHVHPNTATEQVKKYIKDGLVWLPIRKTGLADGFLHKHPEPKKDRWQYYGVVAQDNKSALDFLEGSQQNSHSKLGKLLGYPNCDIEFFCRTWPKYYDPIWQIDSKILDSGELKDGFYKTILASPFANPAMRYFGLKWIFHFPHSFLCSKSIEYGKSFKELGNKLDKNSTDLLDKLVRMPFKWEAYKGVAEITTPIFKAVVNSLPCYPKYRINFRNENEFWPKYGIEKSHFPFNIRNEIL